MKKQIIKFLGLPLIALIAINCAVITVNVYFPTEAVEEAAGKIIDEIEGGEESPAQTDKSGRQSYFRKNIHHSVSGASTVYADDIDLNLTSPAIRKLIDSMKARNTEIMNLKDEGIIGEANDGTLAIREMNGLGGEKIRTVKRVLSAENSDREALYRELAVANKISLSEVDRIKAVFAKTRREKVDPGHWFQDEKGKWKQK